VQMTIGYACAQDTGPRMEGCSGHVLQQRQWLPSAVKVNEHMVNVNQLRETAGLP
jgi:hypothetical protein